MAYEAATSARNAAGHSSHQHNHVVQFYENDSFLLDAVTSFVAGGLNLGQPTIIFARAENRSALSARLQTAGVDFDAVCRNGDLMVHDARATLATFMRGSLVDEDRFMNEIGGAIAQSTRGRRVQVRAFGEMVDVLFRDGNSSAAIRLEELWNDLSRSHSFDLLCAYAIGNFYTEAHARELKDICRRHSHVIPAESYALLQDEQTRAQTVIELQQRARTLQVEIEHRKAIEHALRDALAERQAAKEDAERAAAAKSEFLAVISHELRTPLTAIMGYEELLEHGIGGPVTAEQKNFLAGIRAGATHLLRLIDQILSQSRLSAGKETVRNTRADLGQLVHDCVALLKPVAQAQGLSLNLHVSAPVTCLTDAGKVQQIVLNLVSNAVKFTSTGSVDVMLSASEKEAVLEVHDTGVGIAPNDLDYIFEPFRQVDSTPTRSHSGVGLGLSVSRNLARLLGGDITVQSVVGLGSVFRLSLPL